MRIKFEKKIADSNLDKFITALYFNFKSKPSDTYHFDLSEVEFIGNQELLVLSAIFKSFVDLKIKFEVQFFKKGISTNQIPQRVKRQIIQFWEVWKIWQVLPDQNYNEVFGLDGNSIKRLQQELNYYPKLSELYTRHGITPFITLNYINNYSEREIQKIISPIYKLNSVIENLLKDNQCYHPFTSESLSTIITEELYLNFLDHSLPSSFGKANPTAFMSIAFQAKLSEDEFTDKEIQYNRKINFETESLKEALNFYYDETRKKFKNDPFIQFSFLDFGVGIVETLRHQFLLQNNINSENISDSEVLKYAFKYNSSRHPINYGGNSDRLIPRGLFDALTIVRRYKGLLVVRANYAKILFDFSVDDNIDKAYSEFGNIQDYFPGTLLSIYIPAISNHLLLDTSAIKPEISIKSRLPLTRKFLNISAVVNTNSSKHNLYSDVIKQLRAKLKNSSPTLTVVNFEDSSLIDKRILKKILFFLISDYEINKINSVLIINFLDKNIIEEVEYEILALNKAIRNYKIHPLPIVTSDSANGEVHVKWLGIYDKEDQLKLNELLFQQYSIAKSDFNEPNNISGHLHEFDEHGNLFSQFPNKEEIVALYKELDLQAKQVEVERLLSKHDCIKKDNKHIYLCSGNYYQREFVDLTNLTNDKNDCLKISKLLFDALAMISSNNKNLKFIGISTASQKILKSLDQEKLIGPDDYKTLDHYEAWESELTSDTIDPQCDYILLCDVLSTGYLTVKLNERLKELNAQIVHVAVIVSVLDEDFAPTKIFLHEFENRMTCLFKYPIKKYSQSNVKEQFGKKTILRVNPHTNIPITLSATQTGFYDSIVYTSTITYNKKESEIKFTNKFLSYIEQENIKVGFFKFNNLIHPYFFDTAKIVTSLDKKILGDIFEKINRKNLNHDNVKIFYPRKSGIERFDFSTLKIVLANHAIEEIEIERFGTPEGWRFPHNLHYLSSKVDGHICLILDDGSCSGDSIVQMIDEISLYKAKEIILVCFIGRINDHKREFFSRLKHLKVKDGEIVPISIFFVTHWHIPTYYIDENPNSREIRWLEELIALPNTPRAIKRIASNIRMEIVPKNQKSFKDYKYLPKIKAELFESIPKKELLLVREEIGKVIGYRLYRESFLFFDYFMKKYESNDFANGKSKEIELLCSAFIFEPYLFGKVRRIVPDVTNKIEQFVSQIVFSSKNEYENLTYNWNKKDIVHLFFVVFTNERLVAELTEEKFIKLISFMPSREPALNYILYKLLWYFPFKASQLDKNKQDTSIKNLIAQLKEKQEISIRELKQFYYFISSLPTRDNFHSQLAKLGDSYRKQNEPQYHDEKISLGHNISLIVVSITHCIDQIESGKPLDISKVNSIRNAWFQIQDFISPILSFTITYKEFIKPFPYFRLLNEIDNSREMIGISEDIIFSITEKFADVEKLRDLKKNITKIQSTFEVNSTLHNLISKPDTNLKTFVDRLIEGIVSLSKKVEGSFLQIETTTKIHIPELYSELLIKNELINNLKNHSPKEDNLAVKIESYTREGLFRLTISNSVSELASLNSNGEGLKCIKLLSDFEPFHFKYSFRKDDTVFLQFLEFKILS